MDTGQLDKSGNSNLNISQDENLNSLLYSLNRPKGRRGICSWSYVSSKHLTF